MSNEQHHATRHKFARALVAIITKEALNKRLQEDAALRARLAVDGDSFVPSTALTSNARSVTVGPLGEASLRSECGDKQPRHKHLWAAGDLDYRSEDVADRNIARDRQFPPRVSSSRYETPREPAATPPVNTGRGKIRSRPLIPDDINSVTVADWNIVIDRSPLKTSSPDVPPPLVVRKAGTLSDLARRW